MPCLRVLTGILYKSRSTNVDMHGRYHDSRAWAGSDWRASARSQLTKIRILDPGLSFRFRELHLTTWEAGMNAAG